MYLKIILFSSLVSLVTITLLNISNVNRQIIIFLSVTIFFTIFTHTFKSMINKNSVNKQIVGLLENDITEQVNNLNNNTLNELNNNASNSVNTIVDNKQNVSEKKANLLNSNSLENEVDSNLHIIPPNDNPPINCLKKDCHNYDFNYQDLIDKPSNTQYTPDEIMENKLYNQGDCMNDMSCVIKPNKQNMFPQ